MYFSLSTDAFTDSSLYVAGMFNNYALTDEYKLEYNKITGLMEKAVLIKQGFTNFQYIVTDKNGTIDYKNAIDGNYYQTENNYTAIVYYRGNNDRYDRVIGIANTNSETIRN